MTAPDLKLDNEFQPEHAEAAPCPATQVHLDGDGPFLMPMMASEASFGIGDSVAVMQIRTASGQEVIVPFDKETLRIIGVALADALDQAFPKQAVAADDLVFERREDA